MVFWFWFGFWLLTYPKMKTYRFKVSTELQDEMSIFSRKYRHMDRTSFRDLFDEWYQQQHELIHKETITLQANGYTNDIRDKIYKSIRYYHRKKAITIECKNIYGNELEPEPEPKPKLEEKKSIKKNERGEEEEKQRTTSQTKRDTDTSKKRCFLPNEVIEKISEYISRKEMLNEKPSHMFESFIKENESYLNNLLEIMNETETETEKIVSTSITKSILHSKLKKSFKNKCFKLKKTSTSTSN